MTTVDFITALFYEIDEQLRAIPKHPETHLWPSEVVTLGLLHALKGVGHRAFYRWLTRDYRPLFPRLPEWTRLFRLFVTHQDWTQVFLACSSRKSIAVEILDFYSHWRHRRIARYCNLADDLAREKVSNNAACDVSPAGLRRRALPVPCLALSGKPCTPASGGHL
jgi:hypothetical protein